MTIVKIIVTMIIIITIIMITLMIIVIKTNYDNDNKSNNSNNNNNNIRLYNMLMLHPSCSGHSCALHPRSPGTRNSRNDQFAQFRGMPEATWTEHGGFFSSKSPDSIIT